MENKICGARLDFVARDDSRGIESGLIHAFFAAKKLGTTLRTILRINSRLNYPLSVRGTNQRDSNKSFESIWLKSYQRFVGEKVPSSFSATITVTFASLALSFSPRGAAGACKREGYRPQGDGGGCPDVTGLSPRRESERERE